MLHRVYDAIFLKGNFTHKSACSPSKMAISE